MNDFGFASVYGPNQVSQAAEACLFYGLGTPACDFFQEYLPGYNVTSITEIGARQLEVTAQRSLLDKFVKYSSTFAEDGFCTEPEEIDLSGILNHIQAEYFEDELYCTTAPNRDIILNDIQTVKQVTEWTTGRRNTSTSPGDNDEFWVNLTIQQLGQPDDVTAVNCAAITPSFSPNVVE